LVTNIQINKNKKQIKNKKKVIFIIFLVYLRFLCELFTKIVFLLRKNCILFVCVWSENVKQLFSLEHWLLLSFMYATKKQRLKNCYSCACGVRVRVCWCVWSAGVQECRSAGQKLKNYKRSRKKSTPPIKKIMTLSGRDAA